MKHKIAYIIPTKDHPEDLQKLLKSLIAQTVMPDQIIVVDGSDNDIAHIIADHKSINIDYVRVRPPGLTKQRNVGKKMIRPDITVAGYLDDDLVLEDDATEKMLEFWDSAPARVGGASFNITNNIPNPYNAFTHIFGLNRGQQGVILRSGFNVVLFPVEKDTSVQWLCGGATIWRREVIEKYEFEEWFLGCAYIDDLDYCMRVRQQFELMVVSNARVQHYAVPVRGKKNYELARINVINRYYFVKKYPELSVPLFLFAVLGHILGNTMMGIMTLNGIKLIKAAGTISGLLGIMKNNIEENHRNFQK